jgi:RecA-family ATPase
MQITNELKTIIQTYPDLDIAKAPRQLDLDKKNYKKVFYWADKPKVNAEDIKEEDVNYIIRSSDKYADIDLDFLKQVPANVAEIILSDFPRTLSFGRNGIGHLLFEIIDPKDFSKKVIELNDKAIIEFRCKGAYSLFQGLITDQDKALVNNHSVYKIKFNDLWQLTHEAALLVCLYKLSTGNHGVINSFNTNLIGELGNNKISEEQTQRILLKYLKLIGREDRTKETITDIKSFYKSGKFSNLFSKNHPLSWNNNDKHTVRAIIETLNEPHKKEEIFFEPQIWGQFKQPLKKREFVIQDYLKKGNMTLVVGPAGVAKTTFLCSTAMSYTGGFDLFGKKVFETGNALLLVAEEDYNEMDLRLQATEKVLGKSDTNNKIHVIGYDHNFKMVHFNKDGTSNKLKLFDHLETYIKKHKIGFIGMDPLISYQSGNFDENSNPQMDDFCKNYLITLAKDHNASVMVNHHTNKISQMDDSGSSSDLAMHAGRGASSLVAAARIVIGLSGMSKKLWQAEYVKEVQEFERKNYVAIIDAKNNYSATSEIPKWIKKVVYKIECSDGIENVAALMDCNLTDLKDSRKELHVQHQKKQCENLIQRIQECFDDNLTTEDVPVHSIAKKLANTDQRIGFTKEATLVQEYTRTLKGGLFSAIKFGKWTYKYEYMDHKTKKHFISRTSQEFYDNSPF